LVVSAEGYAPLTREILLAENQDLAFALAEKVPRPARPRPAVPAKAVASTAPVATSAPPPSADPSRCDPPFFVDERGVKRYKPGCLE
jgi:hypothetical protein